MLSRLAAKIQQEVLDKRKKKIGVWNFNNEFVICINSDIISGNDNSVMIN